MIESAANELTPSTSLESLAAPSGRSPKQAIEDAALVQSIDGGPGMPA